MIFSDLAWGTPPIYLHLLHLGLITVTIVVAFIVHPLAMSHEFHQEDITILHLSLGINQQRFLALIFRIASIGTLQLLLPRFPGLVIWIEFSSIILLGRWFCPREGLARVSTSYYQPC